MDWLKVMGEYVWGLPLVVLLVGVGLFLTLRLFFLQIRFFYFGCRIAVGAADREEGRKAISASQSAGDISYFHALSTVLSATVGTGNIVGVAGAILVGGPGALFWMWVTAFIGMATKYSEAVLAVKYRESTEFGFAGGPMYYIEKGLGWRPMGIIFAVMTLIAAFGIGNMVQINSAASVLSAPEIGIPRNYTASIVALLAGLVILGGVKRIGKVASVFVPFMAAVYIAGVVYILFVNFEQIPQAFSLIFKYAFQPLPVLTGGGIGLLLLSIQTGVQRGLFSNEAGLGSSPIADASAKTDFAVKQGLVSMLGPFIDTLIICTLTGLVVITGLEKSGVSILESAAGSTVNVEGLVAQTKSFSQYMAANPGTEIFTGIQESFGRSAGQFKAVLTSAVFADVMGEWGRRLVGIALFFFAISTIVGWYFYSDRALVYLGGGKLINYYRLVYVVLIFVGGMIENVNVVWAFSDIANGAMAFPNLIAVALLSGVVASETKKFFKRYPHRHDIAIQTYLLILKILPKNTYSKLFGLIAGLKMPRFIMIPVLLAFARIYKINVEEAELELKDYKTLNKFFTRALKNGARSIADDALSIISPVDGRVLTFGGLEKGTLIQSKGMESKLEDLLGTNTYLQKFQGGCFCTIYLSPSDYHRIHTPVTGEILGYYYQPGKLFPVNQIAVNTINRLFSRNERLITFIKTEFGLVAVVKVGATSVGRILVTYDNEIATNNWFRFSREHKYEVPKKINKGDELGRFEMGSTVMLLFEKDIAELLELEEKQKVILGQPIGVFKKIGKKNAK